MCVPSVLTVGLMLVPRVCVCMYVCIGIGLGTNVRVWASFLSKYGVRSLVSCLVSNLVSNLVSDSISTCMVGVWFHGSIVKFGRSSCRSFVCLLHHILFVVVVVTVECQDPPQLQSRGRQWKGTNGNDSSSRSEKETHKKNVPGPWSLCHTLFFCVREGGGGSMMCDQDQGQTWGRQPPPMSSFVYA